MACKESHDHNDSKSVNQREHLSSHCVCVWVCVCVCVCVCLYARVRRARVFVDHSKFIHNKKKKIRYMTVCLIIDLRRSSLLIYQFLLLNGPPRLVCHTLNKYTTTFSYHQSTVWHKQLSDASVQYQAIRMCTEYMQVNESIIIVADQPLSLGISSSVVGPRKSVLSNN
jgi:hypothetical protein